MEAIFKKLKVNKDGFHELAYNVEELKANARIASQITVVLEDVEIMPSEPLEQIILKCAEIAKREYEKR